MLSIIVVAHDAIDVTRNCLAALADAKISCNYELVLVDNGSRDPIGSLVSEFSSRIPKIRYLHIEDNLSYSAANNAGSSLAGGGRLLFLNNDVFVTGGVVEQLLSAMDANPRIGAAGGKLLYPGTEAIQHAGILQMLWGYVSNYGVGADSHDERFNRMREVFAVTGAMLCVPRGLFKTVGGFSDCYQFGYEDVDLCLKIRRAGWEVLYVPDACCSHCESATLKGRRLQRDFDWNYAQYRSRWDEVLVPAEQNYAESLQRMGIRSVVIFGNGRAAAGLCGTLSHHGIQTEAFATTAMYAGESMYLGRPVALVENLPGLKFDRLISGSQYFFQVEKLLSVYDPQQEALLPVILQKTDAA